MNSTIQRLKMLKKTPDNGLAIFCGLVATESGKDMKKMCVVLEPTIPLSRGLYYCDSRFHVEDLMSELDEHESAVTYGFIVVTGSGVLLGTLKGTRHQVLYERGVTLPKKHSKGGQSRERFARLREEAIDAYLKIVAEKANECFLSKNREDVLVQGIIIAGSANLKYVLQSTAAKLMDYRLSNKILQVFDTQYGGVHGFSEAIDKAKNLFGNLRYTQEQNLISSFMDLIAQDSLKYTFGLNHTIHALEMGVVDKLLIFDQLDIHRCVIKENAAVDDTVVQYLTQDQMAKVSQNAQIVESKLFIEWLIEDDNALTKYGCTVELVGDLTNESQQFIRGFGGIGAFLKYDVNIQELVDQSATQYVDDASGFDSDADLDEFL